MTSASTISIARRAIFLATLWITMSAADPDGYAVGALATIAAAWLSLRLRPEPAHPVHVLRAARLIPGFLWQSFLGGLDVARRALDPRLPLDPGWFVLPAKVPLGAPRVVVGGEFSLLPGTLVAGTRDGSFLVHVLDRSRPVERDLAAGETALARTFRAVPQ